MALSPSASGQQWIQQKVSPAEVMPPPAPPPFQPPPACCSHWLTSRPLKIVGPASAVASLSSGGINNKTSSNQLTAATKGKHRRSLDELKVIRSTARHQAACCQAQRRLRRHRDDDERNKSEGRLDRAGTGTGADCDELRSHQPQRQPHEQQQQPRFKANSISACAPAQLLPPAAASYLQSRHRLASGRCLLCELAAATAAVAATATTATAATATETDCEPTCEASVRVRAPVCVSWAPSDNDDDYDDGVGGESFSEREAQSEREPEQVKRAGSGNECSNSNNNKRHYVSAPITNKGNIITISQQQQSNSAAAGISGKDYLKKSGNLELHWLRLPEQPQFQLHQHQHQQRRQQAKRASIAAGNVAISARPLHCCSGAVAGQSTRRRHSWQVCR